MPKYVISTPHRLFTVEGNLREVRKWVEGQSVKLKKGWTASWSTKEGRHYFGVFNSNGKLQTGACVCPLRLSPGRKHHSTANFTQIGK